MGKYVDERSKNSTWVDEIKQKVSIPLYFERIIVPARQTYYGQYGGDLEFTKRTVCPLHDEDTPSFYYREELGTYKCFGCGDYGDVISLHQKFIERETGEKVSFESALNFLYKVFIRNDDISETNNIKVGVSRDPMKFTYMNCMYNRALKKAMEYNVDAEKKSEMLWKIKALRDLAYTEGDKVVDSVASELRSIYKSTSA